MKTTLILATSLTLGLAASANAATISFEALNDGSGNGSNAGVASQPIGVAASLDATQSFDSFIEPVVADNTKAASFSSVNAAGTTLAFSEGTFDSFTAGGPAAMLSQIAFGGSNLAFEASTTSGGNGTSQNAASSDAWGVDTSGVISQSSNTVLAFALGNNVSGTFSALILDLEGGADNAAPAYAGVYDAAGDLLSTLTLNFPGPEFGDNGEYLFKFDGLGLNSTIAFFTGDDGANGDGYNERIAAADFATYEPVAAVPLPASGLLLGAGLLGLVGFRRRS